MLLNAACISPKLVNWSNFVRVYSIFLVVIFVKDDKDG